MNGYQRAKAIGHKVRTGHELVETVDENFVYTECCGKKTEIIKGD